VIPGQTLEGWTPGPEVPLAEIVERAFDYRGNVTVVTTDGAELVGYLFNRNASVPDPFVQLYDTAGDGPITVPYAGIRTIRFTGKDPAAGNSYAAWLERKADRKSTRLNSSH